MNYCHVPWSSVEMKQNESWRCEKRRNRKAWCLVYEIILASIPFLSYGKNVRWWLDISIYDARKREEFHVGGFFKFSSDDSLLLLHKSTFLTTQFSF